jgi:hypothetical protein
VTNRCFADLSDLKRTNITGRALRAFHTALVMFHQIAINIGAIVSGINGDTAR